MTYTVVLLPAEERGYTVVVPALPGCVTEGDSLTEALLMAEDAIGGYLAVLADDGDPLPVEGPEVPVRLGECREALVRRVTVRRPVPEYA